MAHLRVEVSGWQPRGVGHMDDALHGRRCRCWGGAGRGAGRGGRLERLGGGQHLQRQGHLRPSRPPPCGGGVLVSLHKWDRVLIMDNIPHMPTTPHIPPHLGQVDILLVHGRQRPLPLGGWLLVQVPLGGCRTYMHQVQCSQSGWI